MEDMAVMFVADVLSKHPANLMTLRFLYLRGKYNAPLTAETLTHLQVEVIITCIYLLMSSGDVSTLYKYKYKDVPDARSKNLSR